MQREIDPKAVFQLFKARWLIIALSVVVMGAVFLVGSKLLLTPKYTSSVKTYVYVSTIFDPDEPISSGIYNTSVKLVKAYIGILKDKSVSIDVADRINSKLNTNVSAGKIGASVTMSQEVDTPILIIAATTEDPELSAEICNALAEIAPEKVPYGSLEVMGLAEPSGSPSSPNYNKNALYGAFAGLCLSVGVIFLIFLFDNTVKGEEDFRELFDIAFLGEIPHIDDGDKHTLRVRKGYTKRVGNQP